MHYYPHHIGDFIRETANLNDHQIATYLRMIWAYYTDEKPFGDSIEDLAFAMRSDEKTVHLLLRHYFKEQENGWHHARCDREISIFHGKSEKAAKAANARWKNADALHEQSNGNSEEHKSDANQEPRTKNQEPRTSGKTLASAKPSPSSRGTRLQVDWELPTEWAEWALSEFPNVPVIEEAAKFRDHWLSKSGKDATKADWLATWRNWVRNADKWAKGPSQRPQFMSTIDHNRAAVEEALRRAEERDGQNAG